MVHLSPDGGDPGLVSEEGVHGDAVLDDEGGDGDERQHQHVQDEELLSAGGGGVDAVAANLPHRVRHPLHQHTGQWCAHGHHNIGALSPAAIAESVLMTRPCLGRRQLSKTNAAPTADFW